MLAIRGFFGSTEARYSVNGASLRFRLREPENAHFREGNRREPSAINSLDRQRPKEEQALAATREHSGLRRTLWSGRKVPIRDDRSCSDAILVQEAAESVDFLDRCRAVEALLGGIRDGYLETNPTMRSCGVV